MEIKENMETIEVARVTANGQVTIPASVRRLLGIREGGKVMFVGKNKNISIVNASLKAFQDLQKAFDGEAEKAGLKDEQDVVAMIKEYRAEKAGDNANNA